MCRGVAESESVSIVEAAHTVKHPVQASAGPCVKNVKKETRRQLWYASPTEHSMLKFPFR